MVRGPTGVLIMRAWLDDNFDTPLRIQMRLTHDISTGVETATTFTTIADALAAAEQWLQEMSEVAAAAEGDALRVVSDAIWP